MDPKWSFSFRWKLQGELQGKLVGNKVGDRQLMLPTSLVESTLCPMVSKGMSPAALTMVSLLQLRNPLRPLVLPVSVTLQTLLKVLGRWDTSLLPSWIIRHLLGCLSDPWNTTSPSPLCCPCPVPVLGVSSGLPPHRALAGALPFRFCP